MSENDAELILIMINIISTTRIAHVILCVEVSVIFSPNEVSKAVPFKLIV